MKASIGARVLLVDDLPLVRRGMGRMLESLYAITVASSGLEALRWVRAGERYDVIVADLSMPEMSGIELYLALLAQYPPLAERLVFSTARPEVLLGMHALLTTEIRLLVKPYTGAALRAALESVLRAAPLCDDGSVRAR